MRSVLLVGLLLGMRHALEADHLAAVASLSTTSKGRLSTVVRGVTWGIGHTAALLVLGGLSLGLGLSVPAGPWFERAVGLMLVGLGINVLWRVVRGRPHVHGHHEQHHHFDIKTVCVGMMHGVAGSAALMLLVASAIRSRWVGLAYIAIFGAGSIFGMAALSAVLSVPLDLTARRLSRAMGAVELTVAAVTIAIGASMMR